MEPHPQSRCTQRARTAPPDLPLRRGRPATGEKRPNPKLEEPETPISGRSGDRKRPEALGPRGRCARHDPHRPRPAGLAPRPPTKITGPTRPPPPPRQPARAPYLPLSREGSAGVTGRRVRPSAAGPFPPKEPRGPSVRPITPLCAALPAGIGRQGPSPWASAAGPVTTRKGWARKTRYPLHRFGRVSDAP